MTNTKLLSGAALLALCASALNGQAWAQANPVPVQLDEILVTDGLTPVEQEKSGRAFTVITGEQLEKNQVRYVADALRQVPGFAVSRTGSYGGLTQVRVRGAEGNHLLVMVDGVEVSETSGGEFDFGSLQVENVDRIEVLRGPQSAFWGSNATAGVVNIITKRGERGSWKTSARTEAGTDGTFLGGVALAGGGQNYDVALSGTFRRNDGFNISDFGNEKDGDRNTTLNGRFSWDVTPDFTLEGTLRYVDRRSDTDPQRASGLVADDIDWTATREAMGAIGGTYVSLDGALTQKARFSGSDTARDNFSTDYGPSANEGNRYNGMYQATYAFDTPSFLDAKHQITGGYEWESERYRPAPSPSWFKRETNSFVGEYRGDFADQFSLNAALRHDLNDAFEDATTYSLSGAWKAPGTQTRLHASVGTGVTNPTFFEQFGGGSSGFRANPNLIPEESFGWDIGVEQGFFDRKLVVDVTYFNQDLTNEIGLDYSAFPIFTPYNMTGESKRQGIEVSANLNLANGFSANATYTYTDSTQQTVAGAPQIEEVRRPKHAGSLGLAYVFYDDRARVFADATFNGTQKDTEFVTFPYDRVTLSSFTVVNVGGSFKFNENLEAYARVENLFDDQYEEIFGYNSPGRTAFAGLKGSF